MRYTWESFLSPLSHVTVCLSPIFKSFHYLPLILKFLWEILLISAIFKRVLPLVIITLKYGL